MKFKIQLDNRLVLKNSTFELATIVFSNEKVEVTNVHNPQNTNFSFPGDLYPMKTIVTVRFDPYFSILQVLYDDEHV